MKVTIKRWGNGVAVRIPAAVLAAAGLGPEDVVDVREESGRIVMEPVGWNSLADLVAGITSANRHEEVDFGAARGSEIW